MSSGRNSLISIAPYYHTGLVDDYELRACFGNAHGVMQMRWYDVMRRCDRLWRIILGTLFHNLRTCMVRIFCKWVCMLKRDVDNSVERHRTQTYMGKLWGDFLSDGKGDFGLSCHFFDNMLYLEVWATSRCKKYISLWRGRYIDIFTWTNLRCPSRTLILSICASQRRPLVWQD